MRQKHISQVCISFFALLMALGSTVALKAQGFDDKKEELKLSIVVRPRAEFRNGVFTPKLESQDPAFFITQRSRLGVTYTKNRFSTRVTLQMLNVWGNDQQVQRTANNVSLFEAWGQLDLSRSTKLRVGRQVFSYDDERILGALGWNNAGRKHDAALFKFEKKKLKIDVAAAFNQNKEMVTNTFYNNSASQPYKSMQFLWAKYNVNNALSFSALVMNLCKQSTVDSTHAYTQTMGLNAFLNKDKVSATASFYYQMGDDQSPVAAMKSTNAWMASLYVNYAATKKLSAKIGSDYLSGRNMNSSSTENTAFNPLYGTHHKFYGYMDYFYVASPHSNVGLWDSYISSSLKIKKRAKVNLAYHHFIAPAQVVSAAGVNMDSNLGDEIDLTFSYKFDKAVKLVGGYSQMLPSSSMKAIKGIAANQAISSNQSWLWLSLIVNPEKVFK